MPGITGIISNNPLVSEIKLMLNAMLHENFYNYGIFTKKEYSISLGYVTIKKSFSDCMPIYNETCEVVLFLCGECYVDKNDLNYLKEQGHKFNKTNASFLVHLYEENKRKFFENLNGMFSGIIIDMRNDEIHLFNDRYGTQRIYYHKTQDSFYFSSEAKSLLKIFRSPKSINYESIGEYLTYDCVLDNKTFFSDISLLPPGSVWTFKNGNIIKKIHYDKDLLEKQETISEKYFYKKLGETFIKILPRYFSGKGEMLALTGGLDTRMILACAKPSIDKLPCYTHSGMYNEMADVKIARKLAKICNQKHQKIPLDKLFLYNFEKYLKESTYISDGLANACQAHVLYCTKKARDISTIRITGKFGSQILKMISGFNRPTGYDADSSFTNKDFIEYIHKGKDTFRKINEKNQLSTMLFKELPWWWAGLSTVEFSQVTVRSPYLDNDFVNFLYRSPYKSVNVAEFQMGLIKRMEPKLAKIMTDRGVGGNDNLIFRLPQKLYYYLLGYSEKIYGRDKLPFSLQHFISKIDYNIITPLRINKVILGNADYRHYRTWFRDELSEFINDILLDSKTLNRPYWNRTFLQTAVNDHIEGRKNRLPEIRKALSIEMIHRVFIEN